MVLLLIPTKWSIFLQWKLTFFKIQIAYHPEYVHHFVYIYICSYIFADTVRKIFGKCCYKLSNTHKPFSAQTSYEQTTLFIKKFMYQKNVCELTSKPNNILIMFNGHSLLHSQNSIRASASSSETLLQQFLYQFSYMPQNLYTLPRYLFLADKKEVNVKYIKHEMERN